MKEELIPPSFQERFSSKSLVDDELVSLQLAAYLHSQKFKIDSMIVKSYFKQHIFSQLNLESMQHISVRTA
jgi:hypothetical protein